MNIVNINSKYAELKLRTLENERLTKGILYSTQINAEGDELPYILGSGSETNNKQALNYWVDSVTSDMRLPYTKKNFELLTDMLRITLEVYG